MMLLILVKLSSSIINGGYHENRKLEVIDNGRALMFEAILTCSQTIASAVKAAGVYVR